jgi:hypothetical protein
MERMRARASILRTAFVILLAVGLVGSIIIGIEAGRSITFSTAILFTSTSKNNTARGVTFFLTGCVLTVITTMPLLGIAWIIDGQADLLAARSEKAA